MKIEIKSNSTSAVIDTCGAELISLKDKRGERMWQKNPDIWDGTCTVLFPFCGALVDQKFEYDGRTYEIGGHGFIYSSDFTVEEQGADFVKMSYEDNAATLAMYPFKFKLTALYTVKDGGFDAKFTLENRDADTLPFMFGWHPGFNLPGGEITDSCIELDVESASVHTLTSGRFANPVGKKFDFDGRTLTVDDEQMDVYKTYVFTGAGNCARLHTKGTDESVLLKWGDNIPVFCVWKSIANGAKYVCLEPWTDMPNDGVSKEDLRTRRMTRIPAGATVSYDYTIELF